MRYAGLKEVEEAGFEILASFDDGMGGSCTIVYKALEAGWVDNPDGTSTYRSGYPQVGSAYHSTHGSSHYSIDPANDVKLERLIKVGRRVISEEAA